MKQPIRILNLKFDLLCEIEDYESLTFTRSFTTYGSFELTINKNKNNVVHLKRDNIVFLSSDKVGLIQHREYVLDSEGKASEILTIKGYTLEHLLTYRITDVPTGESHWKGSGVAEKVIKDLVAFNLGDTVTNKSRQMSIIKIAENKARGQNISVSNRYEKLSEECTRIADLVGVGIQICLDYRQKKFIFDVYEGRNLTTKQQDHPPVIFSVEFDNIARQTLVDSTLEYKNTAIVAGQGEGADREIEIVNDTKQGLNRRELFVDARDIGPESFTTLEERGQEKLEELKAIYTLEGTVRPFNSFLYGKDYDLGDIVTVKFFDISEVVYLETRITQVIETWGADGYSVDIVFGDKVPTIIDKLKRIVGEKNIVK